MKILTFVLTLIIVLSCDTDNQHCKEAEHKESIIFKNAGLDSLLANYITRFKNCDDCKRIFSITFDTDTSLVFSQSLFIEEEDLLGYTYLNEDLLLFYSKKKGAQDFINAKNLKHDSIAGFPYKHQTDLYPFDPVEERYYLLTLKRDTAFKGTNIPVLVDQPH